MGANFNNFSAQIDMLMFLHEIKNAKIFTERSNQLILRSILILSANVCKIFLLSMAL